MIDTNSLRERYSPEGSLLRQYQNKMVEEIMFIDKICKEHNITYFLSGGSALGAVRHGGFIPWDDDLDIALFKDDFKKLVKLLESLDDEKYVLHSQRNDFNYIFPFPKFREKQGNTYGNNPKPPRGLYRYKGVGVDIFCVDKDSYKTSIVTTKLKWRLVGWMYRIKNGKIRKIVTKINWGIWRILVPICRMFFNITREDGEYRFAAGQGFSNQRLDLKDILPVREVEFEGCLLPVPNNYDTYLTSAYGNWRELPKEVQIHNEDLIK